MAVPSVYGTPEDWQRVRTLVQARRDALDMTVADCVAASGGRISMPTWSKLESGRAGGMSRRALNVASRALGWTSDSIERIIAGQDPEQLASGEADGGRGEMAFRAWATEKQLREALLRMAESEEQLEGLEERVQRIEALIRELHDAVLGLPDEEQ